MLLQYSNPYKQRRQLIDMSLHGFQSKIHSYQKLTFIASQVINNLDHIAATDANQIRFILRTQLGLNEIERNSVIELLFRSELVEAVEQNHSIKFYKRPRLPDYDYPYSIVNYQIE